MHPLSILRLRHETNTFLLVHALSYGSIVFCPGGGLPTRTNAKDDLWALRSRARKWHGRRRAPAYLQYYRRKVDGRSVLHELAPGRDIRVVFQLVADRVRHDAGRGSTTDDRENDTHTRLVYKLKKLTNEAYLNRVSATAYAVAAPRHLSS